MKRSGLKKLFEYKKIQEISGVMYF